jgi:hypothetical protein
MKTIPVLRWASLGAEAGLSLAFYRDLKAAKGRETAAGFAYCLRAAITPAARLLSGEDSHGPDRSGNVRGELGERIAIFPGGAHARRG